MDWLDKKSLVMRIYNPLFVLSFMREESLGCSGAMSNQDSQQWDCCISKLECCVGLV